LDLPHTLLGHPKYRPLDVDLAVTPREIPAAERA
jgi:hypothetical protein